jgi:UDP-glucose 4-epimerase
LPELPDSGSPRILLVTGGTGFIGRYLCRHFASRRGWELRRLVRPVAGRELDLRTDVRGSLDNAYDVRRFVEGSQCLIHLACTTNPRSSDADIRADLERNLITGVYLFEQFFQLNPGGHVVFASTGGDMYSYDAPYIARRETDSAVPHSSYSIHKLALEHYVRLLCARHGGSGTVLRIGNPYGVRVSEQRGHGLVGVALVKAMHRHKLIVIEPLDSVRDYLHLDDLARAVEGVLAAPPPAGACEIYNVGTGAGHSINEVIATVERVSGLSLPRGIEVPAGRRSTWNVLDIGKIGDHLGWVPRVSFEEGARRLWDDLRRPDSLQ